MREVITSGSLSGVSNSKYVYRPIGSGTDDYSATDLSRGSVLAKNLIYEIKDIDAAIHSKRVIVKAKQANDIVMDWAKNQTNHLTALKERLKLYSRLLLASDLAGPDFDELTVTRLVRSDQQLAHQMMKRNRNENEEQIVDSTKTSSGISFSIGRISNM